MRTFIGGAIAGLFVWAMAWASAAQTLTVMRNLDAPHYDPHRTSAGATGEIVHLLGDALVAIDPDLKTIHPLLAKSWDVSADGRTYIFSLRDDVSFCSGKKLTADDVVYSIKRAVDPEIKSPFAWRVGRVKDVRAEGPLTVAYELEAPFSELLVNLAMFQGIILNKENVEALGKDFGIKGFDGTGPYCWESWEPRNQLTMSRHAAYKWGPKPYANPGPVKFQKMVWKIVPEESARVAAMLSGQVDISRHMPHWSIADLRKAPNLQVSDPDAHFNTFYFGFKTSREQVADPRVRLAFNMAVNRREIVDALFFGNAIPATTFLHPNVLDFNPKTEPVLAKFDPEGAKKLLDEAGWTVGSDGFRQKEGKRLRPLLYGFAAGMSPKVAEAVQGYLRKIGVDMELQMWDATIVFAKMATQDFDMWSISYPYTSAGEGMSLYFHSANRPTPNRMNWEDKDTDAWIEAGKAALTSEDRARYFGMVQERVTGAALWLPLVHDNIQLIANKKVRGVKAHGFYGHAIYKGLDLSF